MIDPKDMKFGKLSAEHDPKAVPLSDITRRFRLNIAGRLWRVAWSKKVNEQALGTLGNTRVGNCSIASKLHQIQTWTAWTGTQAVFSDKQAIDIYSRITGYDGTHATDKGDTIVHVLRSWLREPFEGYQLSGAVTLSPGSIDDIKNAIWIFGGADVGLMLPRTCLHQEVWRLVSRSGDGAPGSAGGHDVNIVEFDDHQRLLKCQTWGHNKWMSYNFFNAYCDEGYGLASKDWLMSNKETPSDLNWDEVLAEINSRR